MTEWRHFSGCGMHGAAVRARDIPYKLHKKEKIKKEPLLPKPLNKFSISNKNGQCQRAKVKICEAHNFSAFTLCSIPSCGFAAVLLY